MAEAMGRDRDLVLPPNTYACVLDSTKGKVSVYVGPYKNSLSNTDQLVVWDSQKKRYFPVTEVEKAIQTFQMAEEGHYVVLSNPVSGAKDPHPAQATSSEAVGLDVGRKINIPGPVAFPLWPGQSAQTIPGHHLRNNQYLLVRVYDEEQAKANWGRAVVKPKPQSQGSGDGVGAQQETASTAPSVSPTMGQLFVVKGTEVSFYIPPTGVEVVPDEGNKYVREAVTLERLEYCVLLDESGEKSYLQGPNVVFPEPTQTFVVSDEGYRKFRAVELTPHSGIHVKVIDEYTEGDRVYRVGEEIFIRGSEQSIYYPRPEHSVIQYGNRKVHYAIAIPAGEGRYVLDRDTGVVQLVRGPKMFLPDPRREVVVLRVLDTKTTALLYPGNNEAIQVNERYRLMGSGNQEPLVASEHSRSALMSAKLIASRETAGSELMADAFKRGTSFTPPRTIVLDTKYEGAVAVSVWPGYAVLVTNKTGERRVFMGPGTLLLEYDEVLMPLSLSTGRPKSDDRPLETVYLAVRNNRVSDRITIETRDLVRVEIDVSYRVNFEGSTPEEQMRWFDVDDYVKTLTDHGRSRLRNVGKQHGIQHLYLNAITIIRDTLLGQVPSDGSRRPGLFFEENGMRVYDVEVLSVKIADSNVSTLLSDAQSTALKGAIQISTAEEQAERTTRIEELKRQEIHEKALTAEAVNADAIAGVKRNLEKKAVEQGAELEIEQRRQLVADLQFEARRKIEEAEVELARLSANQQLERSEKETEQFAKRMAAFGPEFIAALSAFGDRTFVTALVESMGPAALAAGVPTAELLSRVFKGTPYENTLAALGTRQGVLAAALNGDRDR